MNNETFLRPRLVGKRFENHAVPLEFLKDIAALEELVIEVAKHLFLADHQDRQRSPRGFTKGIELTLTGVQSGSAVVTIDLAVRSNTLFRPEN